MRRLFYWPHEVKAIAAARDAERIRRRQLDAELGRLRSALLELRAEHGRDVQAKAA